MKIDEIFLIVVEQQSIFTSLRRHINSAFLQVDHQMKFKYK